jgi:hypothetical protein
MGVVAVEGERRRVVVQLREVQIELTDHTQDSVGDQGRPVGVEEPVEHPGHPVVVQGTGVVRPETEYDRVEWGRPLRQGVDGAVADHEVAHDDTDHRRRGQAQPGVVVRKDSLETPGHLHARQEVVDDGQRPDRFRPKLQPCLVHDRSLTGDP